MRKTFLIATASLLSLGYLAISAQPTYAFWPFYKKEVSSQAGQTERPYMDGSGYKKGAMGGMRQGKGLEFNAEFLGMSVEDLRAALQDKTMQELLTEKGKTLEGFQAFKSEKMSEVWRERGLSDEEIAQRASRMSQRHSDCPNR